jgi:hypothetical protein
MVRARQASTKPQNGETAAAAARGSIVLDLSRRAPAGLVRFDDDERTYELADASEMSLRKAGEYARLMQRVGELEEIGASGKATEKDDAEYRQRLRELVAIAIPSAPAATIAKVPTGRLTEVVVAFFGLAAEANPALATMVARAFGRGGTRSSRSSRRSTEATPSGG